MKEIRKALARNNGAIAFCIAAFLLGVPAGYALYDNIEGIMLPVLKQLKEMVSHETNLETALGIFFNNYKVSIYLVVAGTLILPTLFIMFSNGFLMGFVIKYLQVKDLGLVFFLKGIIPHGIFELPAIFIAGGLGLRIGLSFFTVDNKKRACDVSSSIREAAAIHILVVTPLLLLAAFVETYISAALIK
ncbi:MAG: stage II sporulation protein M [Candidatus Altiarchaeia archaeon]